MATLAAGSTVSVYCPLTGTMTVTPGTSGRVSINARGRDGSQSLAPRELYTAETLSVTAGDVVLLEAINVAATYTEPAQSGGGGASAFTDLTDKASADLPVINTPLGSALAAKAPLASPTFTGTVGGITKSMVGLGSVDNTADTAKPVSTAQTTAFAVLGPYADTTALESAKPAASNGGRLALVGSAAPYLQYISDGSAWAEMLAASTPGLTTPGGVSVAASMPVLAANARLARAGARPPVVALLGDSTTCGYSGNYTNNRRQQLAFTALSAAAKQAGMEVNCNTVFGTSNVDLVGATLQGWDNRVTFTGGWSKFDLSCFGRYALHLPNLATGTMAVTFGEVFDTIEIYYATNATAANGSFTVDINNETALADLSCNQAIALRVATYTVRPGAHTINLKRGAATGLVFVVGMLAYNSQKPQIILAHLGWNGGVAANLSSSTDPWSYCHSTGGLAVLNPSLTVLCMQINDWRAPTNTATFQTQTQTIITKAKTTGDVLLWQGVPSSAADAPLATQAQYTAIYSSLAASNSIPIVDVNGYLVSYTVGNAAGLYSDTFHLNQKGYATIGPLIGNVIGRACA